MKLFYIALFGLLGVFSRYFVGLSVVKVLSPPFPYGTFIINMTGAFLIGVVNVLGLERSAIAPDLRVGILVGFLGGYTTFSSYCLESLKLVQDGDYAYAAGYFLLSPALGFVAVVLGTLLTRALVSP